MALLDTLSSGIMGALSKGGSLLVRDAPPLSTGHIGYSAWGMPAPPKSHEGLKLYKSNPWAYGGINAIVNTFAMTELYIRKRVVEPDGTISYEIKHEHQALDLLKNHMPSVGRTKGKAYLTKTTLRQVTGIHLIGAGEAFWAVGGRVGAFAGFDGVPTELHPLIPEFVDVKFNKETNYIESYGYEVNGKRFILDPEDVVHFKMVDPLNMYRGQSALLAAGRNLDTDQESSEYIYNWFNNNAKPDTVVTSEKTPSHEEMKRLREAWDERFGGAKNAGRVSFLWGSQKIQDISKSQRDMQFKELKEFNRDTILADLRVGKGVLGMMEDQSRANAETQDYVFGKHVTYPFLVAHVEQLTQDFLPRFGGETGEEFWFDEESVIPKDKTTEVEVCDRLFKIGGISSNEVRAKFGLDARPEPEADALWFPIAMRNTNEEEITPDDAFDDEKDD